MVREKQIPLTKADQVRTLRALAKISSALMNFDKVMDEDLVPESLSEMINTFDKYFNSATKKTFNILVKENDEVLTSIISEFTQAEKLIKIPESYEREMGIGIAKLKSAFIHDIYEFENEELKNLFRKKFLIFGTKMLSHPEMESFKGIVLDKLTEGFKDIGLQIISQPVCKQ